jgi:acetyl-CoA synthetase
VHVPDIAWEPDAATLAEANATRFGADHGLESWEALHRWSVDDRSGFWGAVIDRLGIVFRRPPDTVLDLSAGVEHAKWLPGAEMNIVDSCFTTPPDAVAIAHTVDGAVARMTYGELRREVASMAGGLAAVGVGAGTRVAIAMPMNPESVIAYLAIVACGATVVSIADSFATHEIATRLDITDASLVLTQDVIRRSGRVLSMYERVAAAGHRRRIVLDTGAGLAIADGDAWWGDVLGSAAPMTPVGCPAGAFTNILFSSGTTGQPKAIPWDHTTPLKGAMDAHFHQDVKPGDVLAWPTNLGWMMGPWLIYAALLNGATIALHDDAPTGTDFGRFVEDAGVTMLGVVPSLVAAWRASGCMEGLDWTAVRRFSSTGEPSNADDMRWLMGLAGGAPVIEYCGGTEIGGGYIAGTMVRPAVPAAFSTPTLGLDLVILDDAGRPTDSGEVFLVPPSIGLSVTLLNRDHDEVYHADTPDWGGRTLRRHGDHIEYLGDGFYRAQGRIDDTMNLGGIKVSSAELERAISAVEGIAETAAIAVSPDGGGPSRLVVYAVAEPGAEPDAGVWRDAMQAAIRAELNPLFKVHDVVVVDELPRTASAKVMRRRLRDGYEG